MSAESESGDGAHAKSTRDRRPQTAKRPIVSLMYEVPNRAQALIRMESFRPVFPRQENLKLCGNTFKGQVLSDENVSWFFFSWLCNNKAVSAET